VLLLQCVAVCCGDLSPLPAVPTRMLQSAAASCGEFFLLQSVAVCYSVCCGVLPRFLIDARRPDSQDTHVNRRKSVCVGGGTFVNSGPGRPRRYHFERRIYSLNIQNSSLLAVLTDSRPHTHTHTHTHTHAPPHTHGILRHISLSLSTTADSSK